GGRSLAGFEPQARGLLGTLVVVGLLLLLATVAGGYFLARRALAPVGAITRAANQITADRLSQRIEVPNPDDELGALAATLNGMIARLERSFAQMRRFTGGAAPQLRTPPAGLRGEAAGAPPTPPAP